MPADECNLYASFSRRMAEAPERPCLITADGAEWTWHAIDDQSRRIAAALHELGARRGDRVSVQVAKSPQAMCLYLACLRAGFVFHPLNTAYKAAELAYFIGNAEPAVVVCADASVAALEPLARGAGAAGVLTLEADGSGSLSDLAAAGDRELPDAATTADDLAALLYSSGTTGTPKGIMLTHGNLLSNTLALVDAWGFTRADCLLHALPIFHVHGLFVAIGCVFASGARMRWLPAFNVDDVVRFLPESSVMMGVPTYYTRLLADTRLNRELTQGVRLFVSGSAPLLPETFAAFEQRTGHRILERYGMTETNMNTSNPLEGQRRPGTVGPPLPGVELRVCDDAGQPVAAGVVGQIEVRGPNVFGGYWKLPDKTAEDFTADGFFRTGDQGLIDTDGYVSIVGRAKDMIITGGLNVYPKEVELFVDALPGVNESAVIGVPHPDFGEAVVAVVVAAGAGSDALPQAIITACRDGIADYKVPKQVHVVSELPRNTMGKVQKNVLRERHANAFVGAAGKN